MRGVIDVDVRHVHRQGRRWIWLIATVADRPVRRTCVNGDTGEILDEIAWDGAAIREKHETLRPRTVASRRGDVERSAA